jgi:thiamine pyrophosphokinase
LKKVLLFINGEPPKQLLDLSEYELIACTDGAFHYLKNMNFPLEKLDFISGDFDSLSEKNKILQQAQNDKFEVIFTPDQDKTDFEKALEIIEEKGFSKVDVLGGSGGEMDHFLGNLTVAFQCKNKIKITFFDEFSQYFFIPKNFKIENVKGKLISLYPFPITENITTKGLNWALENENLTMLSKIGTRNFAVKDEVEIFYENGDLLLFIGK